MQSQMLFSFMRVSFTFSSSVYIFFCCLVDEFGFGKETPLTE